MYKILFQCLEKFEVDTIRLLLKYVDVDFKDKDGNTAVNFMYNRLHDKCQTEEFNRITELLAAKGANLNLPNNVNFNPLVLSAGQYNCRACVEKLISLGADINFPIDNVYTPLSAAVIGKKTEIVKILISAGASVNKYTLTHTHDSILIRAINSICGGEIIEAIIKADKKIDYQNKNGDTAMIAAVRNYNRYAIKLLHKAGANVNLANKFGRTPLIECVKYRYDSIFNTLLEVGADIHSSDEEGNTILMLSLIKKCDFREKLLDLGIDINHVNKSGDTALTLAIKNYEPNIAKRLIELGACVDHINNDKDTPLTLILQSRYLDDTIKEMILERTQFLI